MRKQEPISIDRQTTGGAASESFSSQAERELAAFARAVKEMFGSEQAQQSIEDWMHELESMNWTNGETNPDWRHLTVLASARLADRVCLLR